MGSQRECTGNGAGIWSWKHSLSGILPLMKPHPKPSQNSTLNWGPSVQTPEPMGTFSFRLHLSFLPWVAFAKAYSRTWQKRTEYTSLSSSLPFLSPLFSALPPCIFILFSTPHFRGVAQRRPLVNSYRLFCQLLDVGFRETVLFRHLYFNVNGMLSFIDIIKRAGKMAQWSIYHIRIRTCLDSQHPNKSWNSSMHLKPQY